MNDAYRARPGFAELTEYLDRFVAALAILGALVLILATTLHPFNFEPVDSLSVQLIASRLDLHLLRADSWLDIPRNIVLFIPLGVSVDLFLQTIGVDRRKRLIIVGLAGFGVSAAIEGLQLLLLQRSPELSDVLSNTFGALEGYLISLGWFTMIAKRPTLIDDRGLAPAFIIAIPVVVLSTLLPVGLTVESNQQLALSGWDSGYRLALGNELGGDRPWRGRIDEVIVMDRAADLQEVAVFMQEQSLPSVPPDGSVAHYCLACGAGSEDLSGLSPALLERTDPSHDVSHSAAGMDTFTWFETEAPATAMTARIAASSQFSVMAEIQSAASNQTGPARIITLSGNPYSRNFTLGQEGNDLVVRLRTLGTGNNGQRPEFRVPHVLRDDAPHRIAVTYVPPRLRVFVDTVDNAYSVPLAPAIGVVSRLIPNTSWYVAMRASSFAVYRLAYILVFLVPVLLASWIVLAWVSVT